MPTLKALFAMTALAGCSPTYKGTPLFDGRSSEQKRAQAEADSQRVLEDYRRSDPEAWRRLVEIAPICDQWDRENRYFLVCVNTLGLIQAEDPHVVTRLFALHWEDYLQRQQLPATAQSDSLRQRWTREAQDLDRAMRTIMVPVLRDRYARCDAAHCHAMRAPTDAMVLESRASFEAWREAARTAP